MKFDWNKLLIDTIKVVIGFIIGAVGGTTINETTPKKVPQAETIEVLRIDTNSTISVDYNGKGLSIFKSVR